MTVFGGTSQVHRSWSGLTNLDRYTMAQWEKAFKYPNAEQLPIRLSTKALQPIFKRNREFIDLADQDISLIDPEIGIPHFFVVTDPNGVALRFIGQTEVIDHLRKFNVDAGTHFALEHSGINGISLAMRLQTTVVLQGDQHTLRLFKDWTCVCSPVNIMGEICGYIGLSFGVEVDVTFAVPLLKKTIEELESKLKQSISREAAAYLLFEPYNLSNREKEVAFGWLQNKSVLQMSHAMGITEGTVRNVLKKVYSKTGVGDKGQFFIKFLV